MGWSNEQHVNTPNTTILSTTVGNFHGLNCFVHMIYAPQTRIYQNIPKLDSLVSKANKFFEE